MTQTFTIKRERMTMDLLLFQAYGAEGQSLLQQALSLNPGVAEMGPFIDLGTVVTIPERPVANAFTQRTLVSLFP